MAAPISKGEIRKGLEAQLSKRMGTEATPDEIVAARRQAAEALDG